MKIRLDNISAEERDALKEAFARYDLGKPVTVTLKFVPTKLEMNEKEDAKREKAKKESEAKGDKGCCVPYYDGGTCTEIVGEVEEFDRIDVDKDDEEVDEEDMPEEADEE